MKTCRSILLLAMLAWEATGCCPLTPKSDGVSACSSTANPSDQWIKTELYFGSRTPKGMVSEAEWNTFVVEQITPRFPGFTILNANGEWTDANGKLITEPSHLVIILHPKDAKSDARIEELRASYCAQFSQESVLRVSSLAEVSFNTNQTRATNVLRAPE